MSNLSPADEKAIRNVATALNYKIPTAEWDAFLSGREPLFVLNDEHIFVFMSRGGEYVVGAAYGYSEFMQHVVEAQTVVDGLQLVRTEIERRRDQAQRSWKKLF